MEPGICVVCGKDGLVYIPDHLIGKEGYCIECFEIEDKFSEELLESEIR